MQDEYLYLYAFLTTYYVSLLLSFNLDVTFLLSILCLERYK